MFLFTLKRWSCSNDRLHDRTRTLLYKVLPVHQHLSISSTCCKAGDAHSRIFARSKAAQFGTLAYALSSALSGSTVATSISMIRSMNRGEIFKEGSKLYT